MGIVKMYIEIMQVYDGNYLRFKRLCFPTCKSQYKSVAY